MQRMIRIVLFNLLLCLPLSAFAIDGYVNTHANLRSGPSTDYPAVAMLPQWTGVQVYGCVNGYSWCDVQSGPDRGWVYAPYLQFAGSGDQPIYLDGNAAMLGIPIVTFAIGTYWDNYYRSYPWYRQRSYWVGRPAPIFRPLPSRPIGMRPQRPPNNRPILRPGGTVGGRPPVGNNSGNNNRLRQESGNRSAVRENNNRPVQQQHQQGQQQHQQQARPERSSEHRENKRE